ncbi:hypothetical protein [Nannocystis punicea]|uniref:Lipoprotein n=1 Tax=Nannocystis punicea TaxID=2995304 RepID=A0ABY7H694_9BACT|nr:hypothetical protein [Nannocystis poenicansa]WAS94798.1 hypothetical protein O0S08_01445 [Nannocystis poenicansa]
MTRAVRSLPVLLSALLLSAASCTSESSKIGTPCDNAEQCGGDLICDVHEGKGTCQEPHDHGTAGETDDHHETETHETDDHHETEASSSGTSPTEATTDHGETEHGDTEPTGTTADTSSTG